MIRKVMQWAVWVQLAGTLISASPLVGEERGQVDPAYRPWRELAAHVPPISVAGWPMRVGNEAQLFIDDYVVASTHNITWAMHEPVRHERNPIAPPGRSSVMIDPEGNWRMYRSDMQGSTYLHRSANGIEWDRTKELNYQFINRREGKNRGSCDGRFLAWLGSLHVVRGATTDGSPRISPRRDRQFLELLLSLQLWKPYAV
jgi:hypothetical protein